MMRWSMCALLFISSLLAEDDVLNNYIREGLMNNLALKQHNFSLQQSVQALAEARGLFMPVIDISARYSRAGGGRTFDIPTGDMVNPIYKTLNQLLAIHGQNGPFPEAVPNQSINFLREQEHDTRIRLIQPILQLAIWNNYELKSHLSEIEFYQTDIYKRVLISEIKRGYYNYLKTGKIVELFNKLVELQNENLRVSQSLYQSGKITEDVVFRAEAEQAGMLREKLQAENYHRQAGSYFNFMLNRDLTAEIRTDNTLFDDTLRIVTLETARDMAFTNREELKQINSAISAIEDQSAIVKSNFYPGINLVLDYGYQGEKYRFSGEDDFWMGSLVLNWNLFSGFQDKARLEQAELQRKKLLAQDEQIKNQIGLEVERVTDNLQVAKQTIAVSEKQLTSASASFQIIQKKFEEGMASQIVYLDMQTTLSDAAIREVIARYDYLLTLADYERILGLYPLPEETRQ